MKLLRILGCAMCGHAPVVERRGDDSVLICERCHRLLAVFVKGVYAQEKRRARPDGFVEEQPALRAGYSAGHPARAG